jgi:hypothetical protein
MLLILLIIPESPRWLAAHGRADDALVVLQRLQVDQTAVQRLHQDIVQTVAMEASLGVGSWKDLLKNDHIKSQKRLLIACAIQSFQQLGGINAIICKASSSLKLLKVLTYHARLFRNIIREEYWI